jgi:5-methylcytosine-specific restriction endonuclease McrA
MMVSKEGRVQYNFRKETKMKVKKREHNRCQCCGEKVKGSEANIHHMLPIYLVKKYVPSASPSLIRHLANASIICVDCHNQLHSEMNDWSEEFEKLFTVNMVAYLAKEATRINTEASRSKRTQLARTG